MKLAAYAKINLSLRVLGKRPDGFHEIESVMQSVSLCDYVSLSLIPSGIQLTTNNLSRFAGSRNTFEYDNKESGQLPTDNRNLAYRAAELFFQNQKSKIKNQNYGIKIFIEKRIPVAAGLAGGSADAAAVLYGLNQLSIINYQLSIDELTELAAQIGSDVPFCLVGGRCQVKGRGEQITNYKLRTTNYYVLVIPEIEVSSKWAYQEFDRVLANSPQLIVGYENHLEPVVAEKYPVVREIKEKLLQLGCESAQMSGSGPSVFGMVEDKDQGERVLQAIKPAYGFSFLVKSLDKSIDIV